MERNLYQIFLLMLMVNLALEGLVWAELGNKMKNPSWGTSIERSIILSGRVSVLGKGIPAIQMSVSHLLGLTSPLLATETLSRHHRHYMNIT